MATLANQNLRGAHTLSALIVRFHHSAPYERNFHRTHFSEAKPIIKTNPKNKKDFF